MTNGDPAGFLCDQHRTCVRCTLCRKQATDTTDRQRFSLSLLSLFPHGENTTLGHAHTDSQRDSCVVECRFFWDTTSVHSSLSVLNANFLWPLLSFSLYMTVSLTTQASPELRTFLPILQLICYHVSRTTGKSKFHCLSLGLYNIHTVSCIIPQRQLLMRYSFYSIRSCPLCSAIESRLTVKMPRPHASHAKLTPDRNFLKTQSLLQIYRYS